MFLGKKLRSENLFTENLSKIWSNTFLAGDFCEHLCQIRRDFTSRWRPRHETELFTWERPFVPVLPASGPHFTSLEQHTVQKMLALVLGNCSWTTVMVFYEGSQDSCASFVHNSHWNQKKSNNQISLLSFSLNHIMIISHLSVALYVFYFSTTLFFELLFSSTISHLGFTCFMTCYSYGFSNMLSLYSYFELFGKVLHLFLPKSRIDSWVQWFCYTSLSNHAFIFTSEVSVVLLTKTIENIKLKICYKSL